MRCFRFFFLFTINFFATGLLSGQSNADIAAYSSQQKKLFSLIFSDPAGARSQLGELMKRGKNMPDTIQAMDWNILGVYYGAINKLDSSLYAFDKSLSLLPKNHRRRAGAYNNIAIIYRKKKDFTKGVEILQLAESSAKANQDSIMLATIYAEKSAHYSAQQMYNLAIEYLMDGIRILERNPKTVPLNLSKEKQKLANLYFKMGDAAFAEKYIVKFCLFLKRKDPTTPITSVWSIWVIFCCTRTSWMKRKN